MLKSSVIGQAVVVAAMEENLFAGVHEDGGDDMYPAAFVVLTSAMGLALTRKVQAGFRVGVAASWLVQCIYVAKLSMLAIPEVRAHLVPCFTGSYRDAWPFPSQSCHDVTESRSNINWEVQQQCSMPSRLRLAENCAI